MTSYAKIVRRRTPTFPSRTADYYDFTPWGGGYVLVMDYPPGGIVLNSEGMLAELKSGIVYYDPRFDKRIETSQNKLKASVNKTSYNGCTCGKSAAD